MTGKGTQRKEKRKVKYIGWEKKITPHSPKMASDAKEPLIMAESTACKDTTHFRRKGSAFFPQKRCI